MNLASGSEALSRLLPHYPLLMKLFSRGRPRLSTVAKPRLGDRDQHAAKQATKQPRKLNGRVAWERRASTDEGRRLKTRRVEGWAPSRRGFVSFSPMDKFRQARTCCQVCRVTKGERLSFRGAASNERKPRNRRAVTSGGSMNAQESFVARTRRRFNAWKTISRTNRARTISASLFRFLPFFPLLLLGEGGPPPIHIPCSLLPAPTPRFGLADRGYNPWQIKGDGRRFEPSFANYYDPRL